VQLTRKIRLRIKDSAGSENEPREFAELLEISVDFLSLIERESCSFVRESDVFSCNSSV